MPRHQIPESAPRSRVMRMTSCPGPHPSLLTGEPICSASIPDNWPEDGDWEIYCRVCREGYEAHQERQTDAEREAA